MMKMNTKKLGVLALLIVLIVATVLISGCIKGPEEKLEEGQPTVTTPSENPQESTVYETTDKEKILFLGCFNELYVVDADDSHEFKVSSKDKYGPPVLLPNGMPLSYGACIATFGKSHVRSPDGKKIAYIDYIPGGGGTGWSPGQPIPHGETIPSFQGEKVKIPVAIGTIPYGTIHVITPAGVINLTEEGPNPKLITWSPDGKKIAYTFQDGLYLINADGTDNIKLFEGFDHRGSSYAWSPDGEKIAYAKGDYASSDLYVVNADGGNTIHLSDLCLSRNEKGWYHWSPDGKKILYHCGGSSLWDDALWQINADGTNKIELVDKKVGAATWSADGKKIFYEYNKPPAGIYVMNADGSNKIELFKEQCLTCWGLSPDRKKIAYLSYDGYDGSSYVISFYVINGDGSDKIKLFEGKTPSYPDSHFIKWSPDGEKIAYFYVIDDFHLTDSITTLCVINVDGTNKIEFNLPGHEAKLITWSPSSEYIAITSNAAEENVTSGILYGYTDLYVVNVTIGTLSQITRKKGLGEISDIAWVSADNVTLLAIPPWENFIYPSGPPEELVTAMPIPKIP